LARHRRTRAGSLLHAGAPARRVLVTQQPLLILGLDQFVNQRRRRRKPHPKTLLARRQP
jgi:hypothetical protein